MKGVVLEIKDGYAAVLSEDGQFIKVKDAGYTPGNELTLEKKSERKEFGKLINISSRRFLRSTVAVAAALLIFIGVKDFNTVYGTVSLDVNPSIEISLNRYDRVLSVEAVNDDAEEIVSSLSSDGIKYKSVGDVVDMALDDFEDGEYSAEDDKTYVMISANSRSDEHSEKIVEELEHRCESHEDISAKLIKADDELVKKAKDCGTTAGKLYLVESLKDVIPEDDFDESDWIKKPVKDIMREIDSKGSGNEDMADETPIEGEGIPEDDPATDKPEQGSDAVDKPEDRINQDEPVPTEDGDIPPELADDDKTAGEQRKDNPPAKPDDGAADTEVQGNDFQANQDEKPDAKPDADAVSDQPGGDVPPEKKN